MFRELKNSEVISQVVHAVKCRSLSPWKNLAHINDFLRRAINKKAGDLSRTTRPLRCYISFIGLWLTLMSEMMIEG